MVAQGGRTPLRIVLTPDESLGFFYLKTLTKNIVMINFTCFLFLVLFL